MWKSNVNPETGVRYGIISLNSLQPWVFDDIIAHGRDLSWEAACVEFKAELRREWENMYETIPGTEAEDAECDDWVEEQFERRSAEIYIDEPIYEFNMDGVKGRTTWMGGAILLWIFESPHLTNAQLCSPCVPNCGDLDNVDPDGYECYDVPPSWRAECPDLCESEGGTHD